MNKLQGELVISCLANLQSVEHALMANLKKKVLDEIHFDWGNESHDIIYDLEDDDISDAVDRDLEARVLDALEPHPTSLKSLSFRKYRGGRIPKWLSDLSFPILEELVMKGLDGINRMMDLELPSLKQVKIESCLNLKDVSMAVPNLIRLVVLDCQDLTTLSISPSLGNSSSSLASSILDVPQLKELTFWDCCSLRDICMVLVPGLKILGINYCEELKMIYVDHMPNLRWLMLNSLPNLTLLKGLHRGSSSLLTSLKELSISSGCEHELISLAMPFDFEAHRSDDLLLPMVDGGMFPNLQRLDVEECPKLKFSPEWLRHFTSLECITFSGNQLEARKLASLQNLPRLGTMEIMDVAGQVLPLVGGDVADSLPKALLTIASLRTLKISDCPELVSFPETGLPPLLQILVIVSCKNFQYFPTGLNDHTSLRNMYIFNCEQVEAQPDDEPPSNFALLEVSKCPKLEQQIKQHRKDWLAKTKFY